jgi:hypothetical protein
MGCSVINFILVVVEEMVIVELLIVFVFMGIEVIEDEFDG